MVLDTSLLNTQQYKVRIKGKVEQSEERNSALPLHLGVVAIGEGASGSPKNGTKGVQDKVKLSRKGNPQGMVQEIKVWSKIRETGVQSQVMSYQRL